MQKYKTELCSSWKTHGTCPYGPKCLFAHGPGDLRDIIRPRWYKTIPCVAFGLYGKCAYNQRCCFLHVKRLPVFVFITCKK